MILVTGCARSGTTLTTSVLQACGVNLGEVDRLNECLAVRKGLVRPYLQSIGADPRAQDPLPKLEDIRPDPDWRAKVEAAIGQPEPWAYKCPKAALIWPLWGEHFPEAKWVIVRRNPEKIAASCLRTRFMTAFDDQAGWLRWVDAHLRRFEELKANADAIEVWPQAEPDAFRAAVEFCGLEWNADAVNRVIDPALWSG